MPQPYRVILLHAAAPAKPAAGQACNGCGWCCADEPCPLGALLSRRRLGACKALEWSGATGRYGCGVVITPRHWLPWLAWLPEPLLRRLALRWIAAGQGCDATISAA